MTISIDPALIAGARIINAPNSAFGMNLCKIPPEGFKAISMTLPLQDGGTGVWNVQLAGGAAGALSQLAAIYVQNRLAADISFVFPDTGYQVDIAKGEAKLFPVFSQALQGRLPQFYVVMNITGVDPAQSINMLLLNQYVPGFDALAVNGVEPAQEIESSSITGSTGPGNAFASVNCSDIVTNIRITVDLKTTAAGFLFLTAISRNNHNINMAMWLSGAVTLQRIDCFQLTGLNIFVNQEDLEIVITDPTNIIAQCFISANVGSKNRI